MDRSRAAHGFRRCGMFWGFFPRTDRCHFFYGEHFPVRGNDSLTPGQALLHRKRQCVPEEPSSRAPLGEGGQGSLSPPDREALLSQLCHCPLSLPSSPQPAPWVSSPASSCTGPQLFIECQVPRVILASSCRSVPSQVPGLVERQHWSLEVRESQPWGLENSDRDKDQTMPSACLSPHSRTPQH